MYTLGIYFLISGIGRLYYRDETNDLLRADIVFPVL